MLECKVRGCHIAQQTATRVRVQGCAQMTPLKVWGYHIAHNRWQPVLRCRVARQCKGVEVGSCVRVEGVGVSYCAQQFASRVKVQGWEVVWGCWIGESYEGRNTLQHTATHCSILQHTATHCNTLQHIVIHCSTLQHTAAHCNTLQHTATYCNTLLTLQ